MNDLTGILILCNGKLMLACDMAQTSEAVGEVPVDKRALFIFGNEH